MLDHIDIVIFKKRKSKTKIIYIKEVLNFHILFKKIRFMHVIVATKLYTQSKVQV